LHAQVVRQPEKHGKRCPDLKQIKPCPKFATAECVKKAELEATFEKKHGGKKPGVSKAQKAKAAKATKAAKAAKAAKAVAAAGTAGTAKAAGATAGAAGASAVGAGGASAGVTRSAVATLPTPAPAPSLEVTLTVVLNGQPISAFRSAASPKWRACVAAVAEALAVDASAVSLASVRAVGARRRLLAAGGGGVGVELHVVIRVADQSNAFFLVTEIESPTFSSFLASSLSARGLALAPQALQLRSPHIVAPKAAGAASAQVRAGGGAAAGAAGGVFGAGGALGSPLAKMVAVGCAATAALMLLVVQCMRLRSALASANAEYETKQGVGYGGSVAHGYQGGGGGAYMDRGGSGYGVGVDMAPISSSPRGSLGAAGAGEFNSLLDAVGSPQPGDGFHGGEGGGGGVATIIEY
jgi:hypothetical protein